MLFFSESTQGFYDKGLHKQIPEDAVAVDAKTYKILLEGKNSGKLIGSFEGSFTLIDNPMSTNNSPNVEKSWRDSELKRADIELYKIQDSDPKAVGSVGQWREYRKALRAWPEHKDFPNKEKRPTSPDV